MLADLVPYLQLTFPVPVTGALTLTFLSSVGGGDDDNMKVFSNGLRTLGYSVPAGTTPGDFQSRESCGTSRHGGGHHQL